MENREIDLNHFRHILLNTHTGIDASVFLLEPEDRLQRFLDNLDMAQEATRATVWITRDVLREIQSKLEDVQLVNIARRSLQYILERCRQKRIIVYEPEQKKPEGAAFADSTLLTILLENRVNTPITLLTQDKSLALDAMRINDFGSVRGNRIMVYRINGAGIPVRFHMVRMEDGSLAMPQSSGLYAPPDTPRARISAALSPAATYGKGQTLQDADGTVYTLADCWDEDDNGALYACSERADIRIKVFTHTSPLIEAKCALLQQSRITCKEAILPEKLLYHNDGSFAGYTMPHVEGVSLSTLFITMERIRCVPQWTRLEYAQLAHAVAAGAANLAAAGIQLADMDPRKIILRQESLASSPLPTSVVFTGLDTAQFGTERTGIYPATGCDVRYKAPECTHRHTPIDGTLPPLQAQSAMVYSLALLCLQCLLVGEYPLSSNGVFPFATGEAQLRIIRPTLAERLWSYVNPEQQAFLASMLRPDGELYAPARRPTPFRLAAQFKRHIMWLRQQENQADAEALLDPMPTRIKGATETHTPTDDLPPHQHPFKPATCTASMEDVQMLRALLPPLRDAIATVNQYPASAIRNAGLSRLNDLMAWVDKMDRAAWTLLDLQGCPMPQKPDAPSPAFSCKLDPTILPAGSLEDLGSISLDEHGDITFGVVPTDFHCPPPAKAPAPDAGRSLRPLRRLFNRLRHPLA